MEHFCGTAFQSELFDGRAASPAESEDVAPLPRRLGQNVTGDARYHGLAHDGDVFFTQACGGQLFSGLFDSLLTRFGVKGYHSCDFAGDRPGRIMGGPELQPRA